MRVLNSVRFSFRIPLSDQIERDKQKAAAEATLSDSVYPILHSCTRPIHSSVTFNLLTPGWGPGYHRWEGIDWRRMTLWWGYFCFHIACLWDKTFTTTFVEGAACVCVMYHTLQKVTYGGQGFVRMSLYVSLYMRVSVYHHEKVQDSLSLSLSLSLFTSPPEAITHLHCLCLLWFHEWLHISSSYMNVRIPSPSPLPSTHFPSCSLSRALWEDPAEANRPAASPER